jgi:hypothetical protein
MSITHGHWDWGPGGDDLRSHGFNNMRTTILLRKAERARGGERNDRTATTMSEATVRTVLNSARFGAEFERHKLKRQSCGFMQREDTLATAQRAGVDFTRQREECRRP